MSRVFASSGSCFAKEKVIKGKKEGVLFTSKEFTGKMDSQKFWDELGSYAKKLDALIVLTY